MSNLPCVCIKCISTEGCALPPKVGNIGLGTATVKAPFRPSAHSMRPKRGPDTILQNGTHSSSLGGMGDFIGKGHRGGVVLPRLEPSVALPGCGQLLPNSIEGCVSDQCLEVWVCDDINGTQVGKKPKGRVGGFDATLSQGLENEAHRSLGSALIRPSMGPVSTSVFVGPRPAGHLPAPINHDPVNIEGPGFDETGRGKKHSGNAIIGAPIEVESCRHSQTDLTGIIKGAGADFARIHGTSVKAHSSNDGPRAPPPA